MSTFKNNAAFATCGVLILVVAVIVGWLWTVLVLAGLAALAWLAATRRRVWQLGVVAAVLGLVIAAALPAEIPNIARPAAPFVCRRGYLRSETRSTATVLSSSGLERRVWTFECIYADHRDQRPKAAVVATLFLLSTVLLIGVAWPVGHLVHRQPRRHAER